MHHLRLLPRPAAMVLAAMALAACDSGSQVQDGPLDLAEPWTEADPATVGLSATALAAADAQLEAIPRARSLLVVRDGRLAHERYFGSADRETLHDVRSVTKSVVGMLAGIAIEEGHLTPDTRLVHLLQEVAIPDDEADVTIGHLLTMSGGWTWNETGGPDYGSWITSPNHVQYLFDRPVESTPGSSFRYNSAAVHVLGVAIEEATGETLPTFADRTLFGPLGIEERIWEASTGGRVNGGAGLDLRARDLARLGQLFLGGGVSGSRQILPSDWIADSWTPAFEWRAQYDPLFNYSYGHLWWTTDGPPIRGYLAWGYGGQFIYVAPEADLVVVATTDWRGVSGEPGGANAVERAVLDVILNTIVPGVSGPTT